MAEEEQTKPVVKLHLQQTDHGARGKPSTVELGEHLPDVLVLDTRPGEGGGHCGMVQEGTRARATRMSSIHWFDRLTCSLTRLWAGLN